MRRMLLKKDRVIMRHPSGKKPTRFRFVGNLRMGFRGKNKIVEITKFKKIKRKYINKRKKI